MVHMNMELYGWSSLPLIGFLFKVYGADRGATANWCRPVLWVWSATLLVGTFSWLSGHSSGKLFLDWSGYARVLFPLAMVTLWFLLASSFPRDWRTSANATVTSRVVKLIGLALLLAVPVLIFIATSPTLYPAINPDTGGPTGSSQLESSLIIVAILLMLPFGLTHRKAGHSTRIYIAWVLIALEFLLCFALGRADISHHRPAQFISLGSLLVWLPLTPAYYSAFEWHPATRRWRIAFLCWWSLLIPTGWLFFLPGILDHFKFTDGLVAHSFIAMAGFTSALLIFIMVQMLGDDGWIFNRSWSFYFWNGSVLAYVALMTVAGWREGFDPSFTIVPGTARNVLYILRLLVGALMLAASLDWFIDATRLLHEHEPAIIRTRLAEEKIA